MLSDIVGSLSDVNWVISDIVGVLSDVNGVISDVVGGLSDGNVVILFVGFRLSECHYDSFCVVFWGLALVFRIS